MTRAQELRARCGHACCDACGRRYFHSFGPGAPDISGAGRAREATSAGAAAFTPRCGRATRSELTWSSSSSRTEKKSSIAAKVCFLDDSSFLPHRPLRTLRGPSGSSTGGASTMTSARSRLMRSIAQSLLPSNSSHHRPGLSLRRRGAGAFRRTSRPRPPPTLLAAPTTSLRGRAPPWSCSTSSERPS